MHQAIPPDIAAKLSPDVLERQLAHVVDLGLVKSSIGSLWPSVRDGVAMRFDSILKRNLSEGDFSAALDDQRHLIVAHYAETEQATIVALRIAHEFITELLGHCEIEQIRLERITELDEAALRTKPLRTEEIFHLAEKGRISKTAMAQRRQANTETEKTRIVHLARHGGLSVTHKFDPIWDARHEAITTYICTPDIITEANRPANVIDFADLDFKERLNVELSCITAGINYLSRFVEAGDRFVLGVPANFDTLSSPFGREEFGRLCRGIPAAYRPYLLFLLTGVPLGVAQSRLTDLAMALRPFGRTIATVASGCRNFNAYQGNGLYAIALDVSRADTKAQITTSDIVHVATAARNYRMMSMVCGIADTQTINQACAAEVQLLQGPSVALSLDTPRRMSHLSRTVVLPVSTEDTEEWF